MDIAVLVHIVSGDPQTIYNELRQSGIDFDESPKIHAKYDLVIIVDPGLQDPGAVISQKSLIKVTNVASEFLYIHSSGASLRELGPNFYALGVTPINFEKCVTSRVAEFISESALNKERGRNKLNWNV